jgi:zinc transporter
MSADHFVLGWNLDGSGGGSPIKEPTAAQAGPTWLHFDYSHAGVETSLLELDLPPWVVESLVRIDTRPRTAIVGNGVLILLRGINMNPGADPEDMVSLRLWLEPNRLISVRQRRLFAVQDVSADLDRGAGPHSVPTLLVAIIERLADRIKDFVDTIEDRVAEFEDLVEESRPEQIRASVSEVRRQTAVVRRFISPQRDALDALYRDSAGILSQNQTFMIREQADRIARDLEDLDLVRERSLVITEELLNRIAQEQNNRMYVLSIIAAIFLPITFITGVFGMNVAGLPGVENTGAFLLVASGMIATTVGTLALLRTKRWF